MKHIFVGKESSVRHRHHSDADEGIYSAEDIWNALQSKGKEEAWDMVIDNPHAINQVLPNGYTLLHMALRSQNISFAIFLLENSADSRIRPPHKDGLIEFAQSQVSSRSDLKKFLKALSAGGKKSLSIVSYNTYLIPGFFVNEANASCKNQGWRAEQLGKLVSQWDLVHLQEVWGSSIDRIELNLNKSHLPLDGYGSWGSSFLDTIKCAMKKHGGLYCSNRSDIEVKWQRKHTFSVSMSDSKKGIICMLYDLGSIMPGKYVLAFNTHLDPRDVDGKLERQVEEVAEFIHTSVPMVVQKFDIDFSQCALLITGDFNIDMNGQPTLYNKFISLTEARDLYLEYSQRVGSELENTHCADNPMADNYTCRIDYVFSMDKSGETNFAPVKVNSFEVLKQESGAEVSDHWGVKTDVSF